MRSARIGRPMSVTAGALSCPSDPPFPAGFRVWTGPVPTELTQWAVDLLRNVNRFPYGTTWQMDYKGAPVVARKDHHTWTWRGGQLVTGICIPGITLYQQGPPLPAAEASAGDEARFSEDPAAAPAGLSWWQLLLIGVAAGVAADELLRLAGRRRHAA